jgi:hypothetical protein
MEWEKLHCLMKEKAPIKRIFSFHWQLCWVNDELEVGENSPYLIRPGNSEVAIQLAKSDTSDYGNGGRQEYFGTT